MSALIPFVGIVSALWFVVSLVRALLPGNRKRKLLHAGVSFALLAALITTDTGSRAPVTAQNPEGITSDTAPEGELQASASQNLRPPRKPNIDVAEQAEETRVPVDDSKRPISQIAALDSCERVAKAAANNPSTVRMSRIMSASFRTWPTGTARLQTTFTARNAFNLELTFVINCFFDGNRLVDYSISERR